MKFMVLNDGETYTELEGCMIIEFDDDVDWDKMDTDQEVKEAYENFKRNLNLSRSVVTEKVDGEYVEIVHTCIARF